MKTSEKSNSIFAGFVDALRKDRRLELAVYAALIIAAFIIFAATGGISCTKGGLGNNAGTADYVNTAVYSDEPMQRSESETEKRLQSILEGISGAGRVEVMISFYGSDGQTKDFNSAEGFNASALPDVRGVIVLAEGADNIRVRTDIQTAVRTLLGIDAGRIGVYKLEPHN